MSGGVRTALIPSCSMPMSKTTDPRNRDSNPRNQEKMHSATEGRSRVPGAGPPKFRTTAVLRHCSHPWPANSGIVKITKCHQKLQISRYFQPSMEAVDALGPLRSLRKPSTCPHTCICPHALTRPRNHSSPHFSRECERRSPFVPVRPTNQRIRIRKERQFSRS